MKSLVIIATAAAMLLATGCREKSAGNTAGGQAIEGTFAGGAIHFGDSRQQVTRGLYSKGFTDAAGLDEAHFDTIGADAAGQPVLVKVLVPPDTAGYDYLGMKWNNLQVQCDDKGLYSVTMHSRYGAKAAVDRQYTQLLEALKHKGYAMQKTVIGQSTVVGESTDIVGYRYQHGNRIVQIHNNDEDNGLSSISLIFNQQ